MTPASRAQPAGQQGCGGEGGKRGPSLQVSRVEGGGGDRRGGPEQSQVGISVSPTLLLFTGELRTHCYENPIYVFLFWELHGLSPNFHIHVSVSDLYILRIGPHISCYRIGRSIVVMYKSLTASTCIWKSGLWPRNSFSANICFEVSVLVLCSVC